jgi:hypothetical protein
MMAAVSSVLPNAPSRLRWLYIVKWNKYFMHRLILRNLDACRNGLLATCIEQKVGGGGVLQGRPTLDVEHLLFGWLLASLDLGHDGRIVEHDIASGDAVRQAQGIQTNR